MHHIDFARLLLRDADERLAVLDQFLASGTPEDYARYREMVGQRRGLNEIKALVNARLDKDERPSA